MLMFKRAAGGFHRLKRTSGFTIVELVTVLAITGVLFIGVVALVQTQNARSQFAQGISDLENNINKIVTDLHSGVDQTALKDNCTASPPSFPQLTSGGNGIGANGGCLFLGKALQVNPGTGSNNVIYVYTVIGNRQKIVNGVLVPISIFTDAMPDVGFHAGDSATTTSYFIPYGLTVKSSTYFLSSGSTSHGQNLVGFYNSLDSSGNSAQLTKAYDTNASGQNSAAAASCVEENTGVCPNFSYPTFSRWDLCITNGSVTAAVSVFPTLAGIRTEIKYVNC